LDFPPSSRPPLSLPQKLSLCLCRRLSVFSGFICLEWFSDSHLDSCYTFVEWFCL
jgi:hypothetical protein